MKKLFYAITAACAVVSLACMSCGGDDDDSETYTVTYESAVGTAPAAISVDEGTTLSESQLPTLSVSGYTFEGWYVNTPSAASGYYDGKTKVVAGEYAIKGNVTLGASWSYTVMLDPNGATGSSGSFQAPVPREYTYKLYLGGGEYSSRSGTTNNTVPIPTASDCGISKNGYTFVCWNDKADGTGISYRADEKFSTHHDLWRKSSSGITKTTRLYAVWQETSSKVKVATATTAATVLANLEDGDTLIYLGVTPGYLYPVTEAEAGINAIATYLKDTTKQITLDLSYYDGHFTNYDRVNRKGYFENCTSIKKVIIGRGYETYSSDTGTHGDGSITFSAFSGCTKLSEVVFKAGASDGIVTIENYVFRGCAITTMTIPASVNSIYSGALACNTLESVTFANTTGWEIDGAAIDVSDAATNATKLKAGGAWSNKTLFRSN